MTVPIIALDVDGVINSFPTALRQGAPSWDDFKKFNCWTSLHGGRTFRITYSPTVIEHLLDLHTQGLAEIRWLTTWGAEANDALSRGVGFPGNFSIIAERPEDADYTPLQTYTVLSEDENRPGWWKFIAMLDLEAEHFDRKIVWIDDDIAFDSDAVQWIKSQGDRVLGICPETDRGLTREHLDLITRFVES